MAAKNLTAVVINFNTAEHTKASVRSLRAAPEVGHIVVVDNGSQSRDRDDLAAFVAQIPGARLLALPMNLGFAEGSNAAIRVALEMPDCDALLFLNSDATLAPGGAKAMLELCAEDEFVGSVGGRVTKPSGAVDSLGIAFYASCLASNRMTTRDRLFGPTGGCAIYRRGLLEKLQTEHGHIFDPDFFCYAEDTDVAARALLLGYRCGYCDGIVAQHEGQASSGGGFNDFVLYHGVRNSVWMLVKCVPWPVFWLCSPLIALMHVAIFVRHGLGGKGKVVLRLYRDAVRGVPAMLRKRRVIQAKRKISAFAFMRCMTWRFYDSDYLWSAIRQIFTRAAGNTNR
jgi:GT2 family glycosyltransferase